MGMIPKGAHFEITVDGKKWINNALMSFDVR
jgi:hypothetical protein